MTEETAPQLIYFTDPMCSWCYGFAPIVARVAAAYAKTASLRLIMGGLRPYQSEAMSASDKSMVQHHWEQVAARSGQQFDMAFFLRETFIYDTEPACRAVVAARESKPGSERAMLTCIQHAFYAENRDVTNLDTLADLGAEAGLERGRFRRALDQETMKERTRVDFAIAQKSGVRGFPTLIAGDNARGYRMVANGYLDFDAVCARLDKALAAVNSSVT